MTILDFFSHHSAPALPRQRLRDKQLKLGIDTFEAGLAAKKNKEIDADAYQGDDPQLLFQKAAQCFKQSKSMMGQANHSILALANGYLALIRFDGLDGQAKQQDITANMLHACEAINALSKTDKGLDDIPQNFIDHFKEMIANLHDMRPEYMPADSAEGTAWHVRLITAEREYRETLIPTVGVVEAHKQSEKFYTQLIQNIAIVNDAATLLEELRPSAVATLSM